MFRFATTDNGNVLPRLPARDSLSSRPQPYRVTSAAGRLPVTNSLVLDSSYLAPSQSIYYSQRHSRVPVPVQNHPNFTQSKTVTGGLLLACSPIDDQELILILMHAIVLLSVTEPRVIQDTLGEGHSCVGAQRCFLSPHTMSRTTA